MKKKENTPAVVVGIPARMGSSRFPGKPLCDILGISMIEHVYKRCKLSDNVDLVFVAACDQEVREVVEGFGGMVVMTDPDISRPALRVAEACKKIKGLKENDIVVVVQGDEPMVRPKMIDLAIEPILKDPKIMCVNLVSSLTDDQWLDPNEIKVVTDLEMNALYMSRSPIPSKIHKESFKANPFDQPVQFRQVCIFPFFKSNLLNFVKLPPTPLEQAESIEMLRAVEHGHRIRMVYSPYDTKSVDTESNRIEVENLLSRDPLCHTYLTESFSSELGRSSLNHI